LIIDHVVQVGDFAVLIGDDREGQMAACNFVDILNPSLVGIQSVGTQSNELNTSLGELRFKFGKGAELLVNNLL